MSLKHVVGFLTIGSVLLGVHLGAAQYGDSQKTQTPPAAKSATAKAGGSQTLTGCLEKGTEPNTYLLKSIEGGGPKEAELISAPASLKLDAHIGHKVAVTGRTVSTREAARIEAGEKKPARAEQTSEAGEHHIRPTAVKMIANSCM